MEAQYGTVMLGDMASRNALNALCQRWYRCGSSFTYIYLPWLTQHLFEVLQCVSEENCDALDINLQCVSEENYGALDINLQCVSEENYGALDINLGFSDYK